MLLTEQIRLFLESQGINAQQRILVAVSGGMDSMALAHIFHAIKQPIHIAHVHHGKRAASDEEADFVATWCVERTLRYSIKKLNPADKPANENFQDWARNARYAFFREIAKQQQCSYIATAHHFNDKVETFFAHALRGAGLNGLTSLQANNANLIRPFIDITQPEILEYATSVGLLWREDESNASNIYQRNRIRHQLMPVLSEIKNTYASGLRATMANLQQETELLNLLIDQWKLTNIVHHKNHFEINLNALHNIPAAKSLLFHVLREVDPHFDWDALAASINAPIGSLYLGKTHRVVRDRTALLVEKIKPISSIEINISSTTAHITNPIHLTFTQVMQDENTHPQKGIVNTEMNFNKTDALLDFNALKFPLVLRNYQTGDVFRPLGMAHFKKVSDYLTDIKTPRSEKERVLVLTSANEIVWVVGKQIDDRFKVGADTQMMYLVRLQK